MLEAGLEPVPGHHLTRFLGSGAFSVVWEARRPDGGVVALKFLERHGPYAETLAAEAQILQALAGFRHPGVIAFHGTFTFANYLTRRSSARTSPPDQQVRQRLPALAAATSTQIQRNLLGWRGSLPSAPELGYLKKTQ